MRLLMTFIAVVLFASNVATAVPKDIPTYVALSYNVPGQHPPLTPAQVARIRQVLARVKPCQRPLVRYLLWAGWTNVIKDGLAFFFKPQPGNEGAHVFGAPNVYYMASMGLFPGPLMSQARAARKTRHPMVH